MTSRMLLFFAEIILGMGAVGTTAVFISEKVHQRGVVTGILYVLENSSAVVDSQVVCNGDVIDGVRIANIEKTAVEFEKNGIRWKQGIQEKPNPAWRTPAQIAKAKPETSESIADRSRQSAQ